MIFHSLPHSISGWDESLILPNLKMESCCFSLSWVKLWSAYSSWSLTVQLRPCKIQEILILRECRGWVIVLPRVQDWISRLHWKNLTVFFCIGAELLLSQLGWFGTSWEVSGWERLPLGWPWTPWIVAQTLTVASDTLLKWDQNSQWPKKSLQSEAKLKQVGNPKEQSTERSLEVLATPKASIGSHLLVHGPSWEVFKN